VANAGDNPEQIFVSYLDDGRGVDGCVSDLVDSLAASFPGDPLQGWREPEIELTSFDAGSAAAYVRVVRSLGAGLDILAFLQCTRNDDDPLIMADAYLRTERDMDANLEIPQVAPQWPGAGHTGRPRAEGETVPNQGVVRFVSREWVDLRDPFAFPFNCNDQDTFERPAEPPPPQRGWYACNGQIVNVDVVPATIDLGDIGLGCQVEDEERPFNCPAEPIPPSFFEVLQGPPGVDGPVITLAPGEAVTVVLWYALPPGEPPWHLLYREPGRETPVLAGSTFFTQGTGSAPIVIIGR
jgi:hypothetical protein